MRLNKFMSSCGVASRRRCDEIISEGRVRVNAVVVKKMGIKIINARLIEENEQGLVRHSPKRLARVVYKWYRHITLRPNKREHYRPIPESMQGVKEGVK